jgi:hypothetical protein
MAIGDPPADTRDEIMATWNGIVDNDFAKTISQTFDLPSAEHDDYIYRADAFAMTMAQVQDQLRSGKLKYKYMAHGQEIEACLIILLNMR